MTKTERLKLLYTTKLASAWVFYGCNALAGIILWWPSIIGMAVMAVIMLILLNPALKYWRVHQTTRDMVLNPAMYSHRNDRIHAIAIICIQITWSVFIIFAAFWLRSIF